MGRLERRIFNLGDEIASLLAEEAQATEELSILRHLDDDAQRDAAVGGPLERADARETAGDVSRMESHIAALGRKRRRLEEKRDRLLGRLG